MHTCPCFQHSLKSFQLFGLQWSLSHSNRLLLNQQWEISGYRLVDSSCASAVCSPDFFLSAFASSVTTFTELLLALLRVSGSGLTDNLLMMVWRLAGILFSTTEAMMSSRMLGMIRPPFPVFREKRWQRKSKLSLMQQAEMPLNYPAFCMALQRISRQWKENW